MNVNIPSHMSSTITLLRDAYPSGIPESDLMTLMAVMSETGMSDRSVATALGLYFERTYEWFLHDAATAPNHASVTTASKEQVRDHLRQFGFDRWAEED